MDRYRNNNRYVCVHKLIVFVQSLSCDRLCDPMDCSKPGFPVLHNLLELAQTHVTCIYILDSLVRDSRSNNNLIQ